MQLTLAPLRVQGRRLSTAVETDVELSGPEPEVEGAVERLADFELTAALREDVDPTVRDVLVSLGGGDETYYFAPQPTPF